jgi:uncharacterized protein (TIGR04551 family)
MSRAGAVALAIALAACHPSFHAAPLPGAPASATFVDVDGVHVHYRDQGKGPAVVLIHGFAGSLEHWAGVAPALAAHHRVISLDLKGFGWTSRPEGDYSPAAQAALVWHVLDKLGVGDAAIVGHSWGASVALAMAVAQPSRTRRVALYSAYVYDEQVPGFFRWAQATNGGALFTLFYKQRVEDRAPLAYYDERWVTQARIERVEDELARPGTTAAALAAVEGHHFAKLHDQLTSFAKPVLLLWGAQDLVTPVSYGHRLAAELQNAEIAVYERCGHVPMVEAKNPSTRRLLAFLDQDPATPAAAPTAPAPAPAAPAEEGGPAPAGGGGASGDASGSVRTTVDPVEPTASRPFNLVRYDPLTFAAELTAFGAELTPRQYAAPREKTEVVVHGVLRVRESGLYNLDLDRGLDASGKPLFPVPLVADEQLLEVGDIRARTDLAIYPRGVGVAVKARVDLLDNVSIGGTPDLRGGSPATTPGQRPSFATVRRAWGEVLTPIGTVAAGRMGAHFGLGILANSGDCDECDHGDAGDRAVFITPLADHLFAFAYDIASRGPFTPAPDKGHNVLLEPSAAVSGPTFAAFKSHSPATLARRADAGYTTLEYAGYYTLRMQGKDVPASYLPTAMPQTFTSADVVARDFMAHGVGGWLRVSSASLRVEAEVAYLHARVGQPSLIPGAEITVPVTSDQLGAALISEAAINRYFMVGLDGGYASGDDAPGFGAFPVPGQEAPMRGAFEGAQANPPRDRTVDNFRFHPDFRIDQILFREIIGTVTDAIYVRPHIRWSVLEVGTGKVEGLLAVIASWAVQPTSTPSGARSLGVEFDPQLRYTNRDGFVVNFAHGLLLPGAAFDSSTLPAKPAQVFRVRAGFVF